jgi:AcrR family transcriptional regulator
MRGRLKADRRELLLKEAARLFAERGFHGVSIEDLGASAGVSGPAVYRHFASKDDVLGALLVGVSERLLEGGRTEAERAPTPQAALERLVAFHTDFALADPDLIRVQDRDLANLPAAQRRRVRRLQREYVEVWVDVLLRIRPDLLAPVARTQAHAVFGLLNSTPHSAARNDAATRAVLEGMALRCLSG